MHAVLTSLECDVWDAATASSNNMHCNAAQGQQCGKRAMSRGVVEVAV
jgi:hypothetical protein